MCLLILYGLDCFYRFIISFFSFDYNFVDFVLKMVKVVYNTGRRISVDPKVTVGRAIEMVADAADHKYCCILFICYVLN